MLTRCPACRVEREDMEVRGETVVCPACGHERTFEKPPLLIVTGATGAGKTTVREELLGRVDTVLLEDDAIAPERAEFDSETAFNEYLLGRCRDLAQSGITPVLFTTALGKPDDIEGLTNRRYFGDAHFLGVVCEGDVLAERLRTRPGWTGKGYWGGVERQIEFNDWVKDHAAAEGIDTVDTTEESIAETAERVAQWLEEYL